MGSFYGNVKFGDKVSLIFDIVYPNRKAMEDALKIEKKDSSLLPDIYHNRYILIDYGERQYDNYIPITITSDDLTEDNNFKEGKEVYFFDERSHTYQIAESYSEFSSTGNRKKYYKQVEYETISENCDYETNRLIDEENYYGNFDHTVWQKTWRQSNNTETSGSAYTMVADLNAKTPEIEIITDSPQDPFNENNSFYVPMPSNAYDLIEINDIFEDSTNPTLNELRTYLYENENKELVYKTKLKTSAVWGLEQEVDLNNISSVFYDYLNLTNKYDWKWFIRNYKNATGLISEDTFLYSKEDFYIYDKENYIPLNIPDEQTFEHLKKTIVGGIYFYNSSRDEYVLASFYTTTDNFFKKISEYKIPDRLKRLESPSSSQEEDYIINCINNSRLVYSPNIINNLKGYLENTAEILSDNTDLLHRKRVPETRLDWEIFINSLNGANIYYLNNGLFTKADNTEYDYIFNQPIIDYYYIDKTKLNNSYYYEILHDENERYYIKILTDVGHPHFDLIRSTDRHYKLHLPRNWKFAEEANFTFAKDGLNPERQYHEDAEDKILLSNEISGEYYPKHMEDIPNAGLYEHGILQMEQQEDTKRFNFNIPSLGNAMSDFWDVLYPVGFFRIAQKPYDAQDPTIYYEKQNNGNYKRLGTGDLLKDNGTYYTFISQKNDEELYNQLITTSEYKDQAGLRYLFIGNDRDPENTTEYPTTVAEVIRYIYKLLGLKTDNDVTDFPPQETIWGMKNGLDNILGKYNDLFTEDKFLPVYHNGGTFNPNSFNINFGKPYQLSYASGQMFIEDAFNKLNYSNYGPLYYAYSVVWEENGITISQNDFNNRQYYILDGTEYKPATTYSSTTEYYLPKIIFEQANEFKSDTVYYKNTNGLWGLLHEFEMVRDNYLPSWTEDNPVSPKHIESRPKIILPEEFTADELNSFPFYKIDNYSIIPRNDKTDEEFINILSEKLPYIDCDENERNNITFKIIKNRNEISVKPNHTYYKIVYNYSNLDPTILQKWKNQVVVNSGLNIIYEWSQGITEIHEVNFAGQARVIEMMNSVEDWSY